jgi:HK97 family phage portal protein
MPAIAAVLKLAARWAARASVLLKSSFSNPADWLLQMFGVGPVSSGVQVNETTAMGVAAVFACVRVIAEDVSTLTLHWFERQGEARIPAPAFYLEAILGEDGQPNPEMSSGEFIETLTGHMQLRGNGYAETVWTNGGRVAELWPLHPDRVRLFRLPNEENPTKPGQLVYEITLPTGQVSEWGSNRDYLLPERIFHLKGLSSNGLVGLSPLDLHREPIGLAIALEKHGATFFGNGAQLGGVLETDRALTDQAYGRLKEYLKDHSGLDRAHRTAILEEGLKWKQVGLQNDHAQFLESRKYQRSEIAAIFRVPLHKIQDLERSTNNNIEHQGIEYVVDCVRPNVVRWERAIRRSLMSGAERQRYYPKFNVDALRRGDMASRYLAYAVGRQWGWLSADDVRSKEDMNPLPANQGNVYLIPANMQDAAANQPAARRPGPAQLPAGPPGDQGAVPIVPARAAFTRVLEEAYGRILRKEAAAVSRAAKKIDAEGLSQFERWTVTFYQEHEAEVRATLQPLVLAFAEATLGAGDPTSLLMLAEDLARAGAAAHCRRDLAQLRAAVMASPEAPVEQIGLVTGRWLEQAREAAAREVATALVRFEPEAATSAA